MSMSNAELAKDIVDFYGLVHKYHPDKISDSDYNDLKDYMVVAQLSREEMLDVWFSMQLDERNGMNVLPC